MLCFFLIAPLVLSGQEPIIKKLNLNKFIDAGLEINTLSVTNDGLTGFFTASRDWNQQIPFLASFGEDTTVQKITELGYIYNGAISPSGNRLIYAVKGGAYTTLYLTQKTSNAWAKPVNLSASSNLTGGYFHWLSEKELLFYIPERNGDIVRGTIQNEELTITNRFESINTKDTEFSPYLSPDSRYLIFTRYVEGDASQQGLMLSYNDGTAKKPRWRKPQKIEGLPYGWGAFVKDQLLYFSDGVSIYEVDIAMLLSDY